MILQISFNWRAILLTLAFLIPSPPSNLGLQILSQPIRFELELSAFLFQKKFLLILSKLTVLVEGSIKLCIWKLALVDKLEWIKTVRPTWESELAFQFDNCFWDLSTTSPNVSFVTLSVMTRQSRYLHREREYSISRIFLNTKQSCSDTLDVHQKVDLWKFTN